MRVELTNVSSAESSVTSWGMMKDMNEAVMLAVATAEY